MAADDDQVRAGGGGDEQTGGVAGGRDDVGPHPRVTLAVGGEGALGQGAGLALDGVLVDGGRQEPPGDDGLHRPGVGGDGVDAGAEPFGLGEGEGEGRVVRAVHLEADDHPGSGFAGSVAVHLASRRGHDDDGALGVP